MLAEIYAKNGGVKNMEEGPQNTNYHTRKLNIYGENSFRNLCCLYRNIYR